MAEIKLICPGCGAEYVLPETAVPPAGREVECSNCGRVWQAQRPGMSAPLDLTSFTLSPPPDQVSAVPPANRRLAPEVLDILREEVEHERRLRETERRPEPLTDAPAPDLPDADWPATTVVIPAGTTRAMTASPQPQVPATKALVGMAPAVIRHLPPPAGQPETAAHVVPPRATAPTDRPAAKGYAWGFGLMMVLAAGCLGVYLLAPELAGPGSFGETLAEWRSGLDRARLWLDAQVLRLRG